MNIVVGSMNETKIRAAEEACNELGIYANICSLDAPSGVGAMPMTDDETMEGALGRASYCLAEKRESQVGIGMEGGVTETPYGLFLCNWGALAERGKAPLFAGGAKIQLPETIALRIRRGEELGPVMDDYCNSHGVRSRQGAIGIFTNERVDRTGMFRHIMLLLMGQYEKRKGSS